MTKVINVFGGPGIGKSGISAGIYAQMKSNHVVVELVTEVAKDYVWEDRIDVLTSDQLIIFAEQHRRMERLRGKVDFIVTDCPLLMCIPYIPKGSYSHLEPLMAEASETFDNFNVVLGRAEGTHRDFGRYHDLDESIEKDKEMIEILEKYNQEYVKIPVNNDTIESVLLSLSNNME